MSNLGGNSQSEDTDRSNNLQGDPGADGIDGTNGTNGTDGTDGQDGAGTVVSIVGGTNTTVDSADPANPIINVTVPSGGENTTKGDLEGFSTVAARIPVGTDDDVLTADSTADLGVAWKTPAAGGGGVTFDMRTCEIGTVQAFSTSNNACKGAIFTATSTFDISFLSITTDFDSGATYKLMICEVSGTTNIIDVILYESAVSASVIAAMNHNFVISPAITITSGKEIAIFMVRTDGGNTTECNIALPAAAVANVGYLNSSGVFALANNNPVVTTPLGTDGGDSSSIVATITVVVP